MQASMISCARPGIARQTSSARMHAHRGGGEREVVGEIGRGCRAARSRETISTASPRRRCGATRQGVLEADATTRRGANQPRVGAARQRHRQAAARRRTAREAGEIEDADGAAREVATVVLVANRARARRRTRSSRPKTRARTGRALMRSFHAVPAVLRPSPAPTNSATSRPTDVAGSTSGTAPEGDELVEGARATKAATTIAATSPRRGEIAEGVGASFDRLAQTPSAARRDARPSRALAGERRASDCGLVSRSRSSFQDRFSHPGARDGVAEGRGSGVPSALGDGSRCRPGWIARRRVAGRRGGWLNRLPTASLPRRGEPRRPLRAPRFVSINRVGRARRGACQTVSP